MNEIELLAIGLGGLAVFLLIISSKLYEVYKLAKMEQAGEIVVIESDGKFWIARQRTLSYYSEESGDSHE